MLFGGYDMKIAIVSDDGKTIGSHFGRTRGFVIFEVDGNKLVKQEYLPNTFTGHARQMEGRQNIDRHGTVIKALSGCKAVISHGMGRRIYDDLINAGIEVFITDEVDVKKALELYLKGNLKDRPDMACYH